jgi:hypothetical protein
VDACSSGRAVAYVANANALYMEMLKTSIHLLRQHNSSIPTTVYFIEGEAGRLPADFRDFCRAWNVHVRAYRDLATGYFQDNKVRLAEANVRSMLLLDADTFVFADVEELFDAYEKFDVVACTNDWAWNRGYRGEYIPGSPAPLNSGIVLCSSRFLNAWTTRMPELHEALRAGTRYRRLSAWLYEVSATAYNREEFALTICSAHPGFCSAHFDESDCKLLKFKRLDADLADFRRSTKLFHSYSPYWRNCVRYL